MFYMNHPVLKDRRHYSNNISATSRSRVIGICHGKIQVVTSLRTGISHHR